MLNHRALFHKVRNIWRIKLVEMFMTHLHKVPVFWTTWQFRTTIVFPTEPLPVRKKQLLEWASLVLRTLPPAFDTQIQCERAGSDNYHLSTTWPSSGVNDSETGPSGNPRGPGAMECEKPMWFLLLVLLPWGYRRCCIFADLLHGVFKN